MELTKSKESLKLYLNSFVFPLNKKRNTLPRHLELINKQPEYCNGC